MNDLPQLSSFDRELAENMVLKFPLDFSGRAASDYPTRRKLAALAADRWLNGEDGVQAVFDAEVRARIEAEDRNSHVKK